MGLEWNGLLLSEEWLDWNGANCCSGGLILVEPYDSPCNGFVRELFWALPNLL